MRRISAKRRKRIDETRDFRRGLIRKAGACLACGCSPNRPRPGIPTDASSLSVHEILQGPLRDKVLDEPCALLVLCWWCNSEEFTDKSKWPHARQLALLQRRWPEHYDLARFNWLRNPNAPRYIEQPEVDHYAETV